MGEKRERMTLWVNVLTREIKTMEVSQQPQPPMFDISVLANPNCRKCYGSGRGGYNVGTHWMESCVCTQKGLVDKLTAIRLKHNLVEVKPKTIIAIDPLSPVRDMRVTTQATAEALAAEKKKKPSWWRRLFRCS